MKSTTRRAWYGVPTIVLASAGVHCASLVGITDVPGGDGGAAPRVDGGHGHGSSSGAPGVDAFTSTDGSSPGVDGSTPGTDGTTPGTDSSVPGKDSGHASGLLPYAASNIPSLPSTATTLKPGALTILSDSCVYSTDNVTPRCNGSTQTPNEPYTVTLKDGSQAVVYIFSSLTVGSGSSLWVEGSLPVIFLVVGSVDIHGAIDVSADLYLGDDYMAIPGQHPTGAGVGAYAAGGTSAGGGGSFCGSGGYGWPGSGAGTSPGQKYGTAELIPLTGGSAGGGDTDTDEMTGTADGQGGGAIQISAGGQIVVESDGSINVNGSGGVSNTPAAGAGSGGAILLEAPTVTVAGLLEANGGQGADADLDGEDPPDGGGIASDVACAGGHGSGAAQINGANGVEVSAPGDQHADGAGGGGSGRIRINGTHVSVTGTVTPTMGSACATQGALP